MVKPTISEKRTETHGLDIGSGLCHFLSCLYMESSRQHAFRFEAREKRIRHLLILMLINLFCRCEYFSLCVEYNSSNLPSSFFNVYISFLTDTTFEKSSLRTMHGFVCSDLKSFSFSLSKTSFGAGSSVLSKSVQLPSFKSISEQLEIRKSTGSSLDDLRALTVLETRRSFLAIGIMSHENSQRVFSLRPAPGYLRSRLATQFS